MRFGELLETTYLRRPNRFLVEVELDGVEVEAFMPNPGRMKEFMEPGTRLFVERVESPDRKTDFDVKLVEYGGELVALDSRKAHHLLAEAVEAGDIAEFENFEVERKEPRLEDSVLDLLLTDGEERVFLEAKSCTLVVDGQGLFPDAPTERGRRHLRELRELVESGERACAFFLVPRGDAETLSPNRLTDPDFADELERCAEAGVDILAYGCEVTREGIAVDHPVEVEVEGEMPEEMPWE